MSGPFVPPYHMQSPPHPPAPGQHPYSNGAIHAPLVASNIGHTGQMEMLRYPYGPPHGALEAAQMRDRQKKETKRRTKTGCLTCRRRRIKCDEGQPTCHNCQRSKRVCLGYDPIFKQQQPTLQPALLPAHFSPPHGLAPISPGGPPPSQPFPEYGAPLDPSLAGGDPPFAMSQHAYVPALQPTRQVRATTMDELFSINDIAPPFTVAEAPQPLPPAMRQEVESLYKFHYAAGLDGLFDTTWYSSHGPTHLASDPGLQDFVRQCTEHFQQKADPRTDQSLESRLVWQLAIMPRSARAGGEPDDGTAELLARIDAVETLLTGQFLDAAKAPGQPSTAEATASAGLKYYGQAFWHELGRVVSLRDDRVDAAGHRDIGNALVRVRAVLGLLEPRDVLYSMALARHIGGRLPEFHPHRPLMAASNDPNDDINMLIVAHEFIAREEHHANTQVLQCICSMAIRSWVVQKQ